MDIKDEERMATIPVIVHQLGMERLMRIIRLLVVIIIVLSGIVAYCIYEMNQYEYADVDLDSQSGGIASYMGNHANGVINGDGKGTDEDQKEQE